MANKRVIDLPDLSQEVQEGQYVLVDSVGGTGKMDLKHIVDEAGSFDPAGEYPELFAGNLTTDKAQEDKIPYLFRKTGGNLSRVGERCYETIIGASVGENQIFDPSRVEYGAFPFTKNGIEFTLSAEGRIILNGTATADTSALGFAKILSGHKYYRKNLRSNAFNTFSYYPLDDESVVNATGDNEYAVISIQNGTTVTNYEYGGMIIDLTTELGSSIADYIYSLETATAGSGIAKLREWGFLRGYQAYNSGSIESVEVTGKVVRGFNLFNKDEAVEGVYIRDSNGSEGATQGAISTGWIPVIGGEDYFIVNTATSGRWGAWYDADKIFISACVGDGVKTAPLNAGYMRMTIKSAEDSLGSVDTFCFNLSSDRNGEYEAYTEQTYDYGDDTLRGIFKLDANFNLYADGDTKTSDRVITRKYGIVDLGSFPNNSYNHYEYSGGIDGFTITALKDIAKKASSFDDIANALASGFIITSDNAFNASGKDKEICINTLGIVKVKFDGMATVEAFKSAMSGVYLVYELATPTTEQGDPFPSPQVCYPDGTEEYITETGVPVGHETSYPYDLKGLVEGLIDVPDIPSANGTYVLKATRSASGVAYNWVTG